MRTALAFALVLVACAAPATTVATAPTSTLPPHATPAPSVNIFDMMGGAPPATVFALAGSTVRAVRLLDHFVKYEIPTAGGGQLLVSSDLTRLYVADQPGSGVRLRAFEVATGRELAAAQDEVPTKLMSLAEGVSGRILVLGTDGRRIWVDAYDGATLRPAARDVVERRVLTPAWCGDLRLVATGVRVAIVCLDDGTATVAVGSTTAEPRLAPGPIAGVAALDRDGTLVAVTPAGEVWRLRPGASEPEAAGRAAGTGEVPRDGLAASVGIVIVARGGAEPTVQAMLQDGASSGPLRIPVTPTRGLLVSWPFAYFTGAGALYHVDLGTGTVERMAGGFEGEVIPAALAPQ